MNNLGSRESGQMGKEGGQKVGLFRPFRAEGLLTGSIFAVFYPCCGKRG